MSGIKRYQVFISSTFLDLKEERQEVLEALLELGCIPTAMEFFPASHESQLSYVKGIMSNCDYFILVVGGRYGSEAEGDVSFTEQEFRLAQELNLPVLAFIHENPESIPAGKTDFDINKRERLEAFKARIGKKLYKTWRDATDLGAKVSRAMTQIISQNPGTGWIRADAKTSEHLELIEKYGVQLQKTHDLELKCVNSTDTFRNFDQAWTSIERCLISHIEKANAQDGWVNIRMLGLCLHKSLPPVKQFLLGQPRSRIGRTRIQLRLSILDNQCPSWQLLNQRWDKLLPVFDDDLEDLINGLKKRDYANISLKLTRYNHMPNWHGILMRSDSGTDLFLSSCIWDRDKKLTAGQNLYQHFILGQSDLHDFMISLYKKWFDFGRYNGSTAQEETLLYDSELTSKSTASGGSN